jgi:hypothetical protein
MKNYWLFAALPAAALEVSDTTWGASAASRHRPTDAARPKLLRRQWGSGVSDWFHRQVAPWFQQHELDEADEVPVIPIMSAGDRIPQFYKVPMKVGVFDVELLLDTGSPDTWVFLSCRIPTPSSPCPASSILRPPSHFLLFAPSSFSSLLSSQLGYRMT